MQEVERLIKKHESFEKSAIAQDERFQALKRLTTVNLFLPYFLTSLTWTKSLLFLQPIYLIFVSWLQLELKQMARRRQTDDERRRSEQRRLEQQMGRGGASGTGGTSSAGSAGGTGGTSGSGAGGAGGYVQISHLIFTIDC